MFSLSVVIGNAIIPLLYRSKDTGLKSRDTLAQWANEVPMMAGQSRAPLSVDDDFGQQICVTATGFKGYLFEDLEQSKVGHCERALHQQRTMFTAQRMAESDTTLKTARLMQGPAMIDPMGMNGRR